ncbi:unnamed protein product [Arctia plantaginis]|uniref:Uncharacterized protein n=1 Tax=Arctia plantaginis TaxID=874455 RepID=A0A8S1A8E8_ARCPL|nr:unnamed protein product [Arctia plantaginis]
MPGPEANLTISRRHLAIVRYMCQRQFVYEKLLRYTRAPSSLCTSATASRKVCATLAQPYACPLSNTIHTSFIIHCVTTFHNTKGLQEAFLWHSPCQYTGIGMDLDGCELASTGRYMGTNKGRAEIRSFMKNQGDIILLVM